MRLRSFFALAPIALLTPLSLLRAQSPTPSVFGYTDFTAQAKIDAAFLAVPDAKFAGQELKILTA